MKKKTKNILVWSSIILVLLVLVGITFRTQFSVLGYDTVTISYDIGDETTSFSFSEEGYVERDNQACVKVTGRAEVPFEDMPSCDRNVQWFINEFKLNPEASSLAKRTIVFNEPCRADETRIMADREYCVATAGLEGYVQNYCNAFIKEECAEIGGRASLKPNYPNGYCAVDFASGLKDWNVKETSWYMFTSNGETERGIPTMSDAGLNDVLICGGTDVQEQRGTMSAKVVLTKEQVFIPEPIEEDPIIEDPVEEEPEPKDRSKLWLWGIAFVVIVGIGILMSRKK